VETCLESNEKLHAKPNNHFLKKKKKGDVEEKRHYRHGISKKRQRLRIKKNNVGMPSDGQIAKKFQLNGTEVLLGGKE